MIQVKRIYDPLEPTDGKRFLVDGLWPRGKSKEELALEAWLKELAPTPSLRRWYRHQPGQWQDFLTAYFAELEQKPQHWQGLLQAAREGNVTLLYASRDRQRNHAVALKAFLEPRLG